MDAARLPIEDALSREWFAAVHDGRLTAERCGACGQMQFYPRGHCASCWGSEMSLVTLSGRGRLYSFTVVRVNGNPEFASDCPYGLALVDLDEGVRMMARLTDEPTGLRCGVAVQVRCEDFGSGVPLPVAHVMEGNHG